MEKGRVAHSPLFLVRFVKISGTFVACVATVAPKKIAKTAVQRNRIRRKLYEAVRSFRGDIQPGMHILVFAKPALLVVSQKDITADLKALFVKASIMR